MSTYPDSRQWTDGWSDDVTPIDKGRVFRFHLWQRYKDGYTCSKCRAWISDALFARQDVVTTDNDTSLDVLWFLYGHPSFEIAECKGVG